MEELDPQSSGQVAPVVAVPKPKRKRHAAEQIPPHPTTQKLRAGDPGFRATRALHPITRKTKTARAGGPPALMKERASLTPLLMG